MATNSEPLPVSYSLVRGIACPNPPISSTSLILTRFSFFFQTETREEAHGVFRQTWNKRLDYQQSFVLRDNPYFESPPSSSGIIPDFDAPVKAANNYGQRLLAYFQVCCHFPNDWLWLTDQLIDCLIDCLNNRPLELLANPNPDWSE